MGKMNYKQNKDTHREQANSGWVGRLREGVAWLNKKEKKLMDADNSVVTPGGERVREGWRGGQMVMDGDWTWGGEHTTQGTDGVLLAVHLTPVYFC